MTEAKGKLEGFNLDDLLLFKSTEGDTWSEGRIVDLNGLKISNDFMVHDRFTGLGAIKPMQVEDYLDRMGMDARDNNTWINDDLVLLRKTRSEKFKVGLVSVNENKCTEVWLNCTPISFVHELQGILRQCGIDNFSWQDGEKGQG